MECSFEIKAKDLMHNNNTVKKKSISAIFLLHQQQMSERLLERIHKTDVLLKYTKTGKKKEIKTDPHYIEQTEDKQQILQQYSSVRE